MDEGDKIQQILMDVQWLRDNLVHLQSIVESERDVRKEKNIEVNKRITELDKNVRDIFYDPEKGFLIKIDRLTQESADNKVNKLQARGQFRGLWVSVIVAIITIILTIIFK